MVERCQGSGVCIGDIKAFQAGSHVVQGEVHFLGAAVYVCVYMHVLGTIFECSCEISQPPASFNACSFSSIQVATCLMSNCILRTSYSLL